MLNQKLISFNMRETLENPPLSVDDLLDRLNDGMNITADDVRLAGVPIARPWVERAIEEGAIKELLLPFALKAETFHASTLIDHILTLDRTNGGHTNWVTSVAFSPDGKILASGSHDSSIKIIDWATGEVLFTLDRTNGGHTNWVTSVAFSPDGQHLASGSREGFIKIIERETGKVIFTLDSTNGGHTNWVTSVAFSPDGKYLASGSADCTIKITEIWKFIEKSRNK